MPPIGARLKSAVIFIHRWMGVGFCCLFLLWFVSGMFMLYCDYPMVKVQDRLARASVLNPAGVRLSPQEAYMQLQTSASPDRVRIDMFDGRPIYRFRFGPDESFVYADNGSVQDEFPPELTLRIASSWSGQSPAAARVEEKTREDQWTVSGEFAALRPLRKYSWPNGEEVYVSAVTGEVVQYTTRTARMKAYFGPIPHWLYFTPLRKHENNWSRLVIATSGLATLAAILGIVAGLWSYSPSKRYRHANGRSSIPYVGTKRWHMILGLVFGPIACTWAFSGMLSMDPFPQFQLQSADSAAMSAQVAQALRGLAAPMTAFAAKPPKEAMLELGSDFRVNELELTSFAGEPIYLATAGPNQSRIVPVHGQPAAEFDRQAIVDRVRQAEGLAELEEVRFVTRYEAYYVDRRNSLPLPVIFVQLKDREHSAYYIDPKTAQIVRAFDARSRWNRWVYHGLHSMDLPWLYRHRPVWDIVVLALLLGGAALCVTSLMLSWGVLRRNLRRTPLVPEGRRGRNFGEI